MAIELVNKNKSLEFQTDKTNLSFAAPRGGGAVKSVNEKTGHVVLTADDIGALSKDTIIPSVEGLVSKEYVDNAILNNHSDINYLNDLIETDMLPSIHNTDGKILTDSSNQIILRY